MKRFRYCLVYPSVYLCIYLQISRHGSSGNIEAIQSDVIAVLGVNLTGRATESDVASSATARVMIQRLVKDAYSCHPGSNFPIDSEGSKSNTISLPSFLSGKSCDSGAVPYSNSSVGRTIASFSVNQEFICEKIGTKCIVKSAKKS